MSKSEKPALPMNRERAKSVRILERPSDSLLAAIFDWWFEIRGSDGVLPSPSLITSNAAPLPQDRIWVLTPLSDGDFMMGYCGSYLTAKSGRNLTGLKLSDLPRLTGSVRQDYYRMVCDAALPLVSETVLVGANEAQRRVELLSLPFGSGNQVAQIVNCSAVMELEAA